MPDSHYAATIIDGAAIALSVRTDVKGDVVRLFKQGVVPGLTVVIVGDDPASHVYVRAKGKACADAGMRDDIVMLPADTREEDLLALIDRLNADANVHGILVQMPLPAHIRPRAVIERISPMKDVDGFHPVNAGKLLIGEDDGFIPCTPLGIMEMLRRSGVRTRGAHAVVIGRSNIVGKPMSILLSRPGADATVTLCHSRTIDLAEHTRRADIIVSAAGRPGTVTGDMVKRGATVIDVGTTRVADATRPKGYRIVGDVDFEPVRERVAAITPVPGGVGPMTIAMLLRNTVTAAERAALSLGGRARAGALA